MKSHEEYLALQASAVLAHDWDKAEKYNRLFWKAIEKEFRALERQYPPEQLRAMILRAFPRDLRKLFR